VVGRSNRTPWSWSWVLWAAKGFYYRGAYHRKQSSATVCRNDSKGSNEGRRNHRQENRSECKTRPAHYPPTIEDQKQKSRTVILVENEDRKMVKEALLIGLLAALPSNAVAQSPCGGPREMTICEAELYEAGVIWEGRARETKEKLKGCLDKLKVRTSTVIKALVVPPPIEIQPTAQQDIVLLGLVGVSGLGIGALLGILLIQ